MKYREFSDSARLAMLNAVLRCVRTKRLPLPTAVRDLGLSRASALKAHLILALLRRRFAPVVAAANGTVPVNDRRPETSTSASRADPRIWVLWFQGEENAPPLVKRCIESIRAHAGRGLVTVVDQTNFSEFVHIPQHIISKLNAGLISRTHFSDILRACLLYENGGMWVDATVFLSKKIPPEFFDLNICTLRFDSLVSADSISRGRWTGYCLAGTRGHPLFWFLRECFFLYWKDSNSLIDYFLIDYLIRLASTEIDVVRIDLDSVPVLGNNRFLLVSLLNSACDDMLTERLRSDPVGIYKLSFKERYLDEVGGKATYFKRHFM